MTIRQSDTIDALCAAFVAAQAEFPSVPKETRGQVGNAVRMYADLATVIETLQPILARHDLGYVQFPSTGTPGHVAVTTRLIHKSGQWMEDEVLMPAGNNGAQGVGSGITYARRYSLLAVLGVAADDDDGAAASQGTRAARQPRQTPNTPPPPDAAPSEPQQGTVTEAQIKKISACYRAIGINEREERVAFCSKHIRPIQSHNDLTKREGGQLIELLEDIEHGRKSIEWTANGIEVRPAGGTQ